MFGIDLAVAVTMAVTLSSISLNLCLCATPSSHNRRGSAPVGSICVRCRSEGAACPILLRGACTCVLTRVPFRDIAGIPTRSDGR